MNPDIDVEASVQFQCVPGFKGNTSYFQSPFDGCINNVLVDPLPGLAGIELFQDPRLTQDWQELFGGNNSV